MSLPNKRFWIPALIALSALLMVLPMAWLGAPSGHDFEFHCSSWYDVARQWREGVVYPRWAVWANYGAGEPRFVFYPPLSWTWGALLTLFVPYTIISGVYVWSVLCLAGAAMYKLARRWMTPGAALIAAAVYQLNPYSILVVYWRSALAELVALSIFPLVLLAFLRVMEKGRSRDIGLLAIAFASIWLANTPSALLVSYLLVFLTLIWTLLNRQDWLKYPLRVAAALSWGFALSSFYLLPAILEQKALDLVQVTEPALSPRLNRLFSGIGSPLFARYNYLVSCVVVVLLAVLIIAATLNRGRAHSSERVLVWSITGVTAFLLSHLSLPIWEHAPKLRFVQFPWRLSFVVAAAAAIALARAGRKIQLPLIACLMVLPWLLAPKPLAETYMVGTGDAEIIRDAVASGLGYEGIWDYAPARSSIDHIMAEEPAISVQGGTGRVSLQRALARTYEIDARANDTQIELKLLDFPNWVISVDGREIPHQHDDTGRLVFPVSRGQHQVTAIWRAPSVGPCAKLVGGLAWLAVGIALWKSPGKRVVAQESACYKLINN
jgi:hypothetical protein